MRFLHSLWPTRIGFSLLLLVELLGATGVLPITPEFTWKGMLLQSLFVWGSLEFVGYLIPRHKLRMSVGFVALIVMAQSAADAIGDMGHLYGRFEWYDQILHLTGGFTISLMTTALFYSLHQRYRRKALTLAEIFFEGFSLSVVFQVIYEFEEYFEDLLTGSHRLGDAFDTVNDLTLGLFGALLAALLIIKLPRLTSKR
jgi:hypothetical protein